MCARSHSGCKLFPIYTWTQIEHPLVIMWLWMIYSKALIPHMIIQADIATPPMMINTLFQTSEPHQLDSNHATSKNYMLASTSTICHPFGIVHLSKIMEGARYCGNRYGSSIPKRFGSHQMSHSIGIWPTTKII